MYINPLVARGPVTALGILVTTAVFSGGAFFTAIRNTAIDCADGSATHAACGVDLLTDVVTALVSIGAASGALFIGLASPTPRSSLVFKVDGQQIDWYQGVSSHRFGLNRTIENPATVEWQLNATSPVSKYITYSKDGDLYMAHDTGLDMSDPSGKRGLCRAYVHTLISGDDLSTSAFKTAPTTADYQAAGATIFNYMVSSNRDFTCFRFNTNDGYYAKFQLGASCDGTTSPNLNCASGNYNDDILDLQF